LNCFFKVLSPEHDTSIIVSFFVDGADHEEILPIWYNTAVDNLAADRARALQLAFFRPQFELPIQAQSYKSKFGEIIRKHKYLRDILVMSIFDFADNLSVFNYYQVEVRGCDRNKFFPLVIYLLRLSQECVSDGCGLGLVVAVFNFVADFYFLGF
jgi:hypothetical protein